MAPVSAKTLLEVDGVSLRFGGLTVLDDVSFTVDDGDVLALIGPNGAGKTSLFNVLTGAYRPGAGAIRLHDDGGMLDLLGVRRHRLVDLGISRTFQNLQLTPDLTVLDNVLVGRHHLMRSGALANLLWLGKASREQRTHELVAWETLDHLGLADLADQPVTAVSYGTRKLVELARALAARPRLLLLDEPAAGLDDEETDAMADLLRRISASGTCTIVLIEHDMRMVMGTADRIVTLDHGRVLAQGTAEEIRAHPEVVAAYLGVDAG